MLLQRKAQAAPSHEDLQKLLRDPDFDRYLRSEILPDITVLTLIETVWERQETNVNSDLVEECFRPAEYRTVYQAIDQLESKGIVERKKIWGTPHGVNYQLTDFGLSVLKESVPGLFPEKPTPVPALPYGSFTLSTPLPPCSPFTDFTSAVIVAQPDRRPAHTLSIYDFYPNEGPDAYFKRKYPPKKK